MATRKATARLIMKENTTVTLRGSLFFPIPLDNLVSFAQLIKYRAEIVAESGVLMITLKGQQTICVDSTCNFFEIIVIIKPSQQALVTTTMDKPSAKYIKWHRKLDHARAARIQAAVKNKVP